MPSKIEIDKDKLTKLHSQGLSNSQIAKIFGVSYPTISKNLETIGLTSNKVFVQQEVVGGLYKCLKCNIFYTKDSYALNANGKSWRRTCKMCNNQQTVLRRYSTQEQRIRHKVNRLRAYSMEKNISFDIDYEYLLDLIEKQEYKCFYTDEPLVFYGYKETPSRSVAPSIDKVIPQKGYVKGNVVWCLERINRIKQDMTLEEMKEWTPEWYRRIKNDF